jgi:hypothetical protein
MVEGERFSSSSVSMARNKRAAARKRKQDLYEGSPAYYYDRQKTSTEVVMENGVFAPPYCWYKYITASQHTIYSHPVRILMRLSASNNGSNGKVADKQICNKRKQLLLKY